MDITYIRGNVLQFSTTFYDAAGEVTDPDSATLTVSIAALAGESVGPITITMTQSGATWTALWDTFGLPPGIVYWAVQALLPHGADQGTFDLTANFANAS